MSSQAESLYSAADEAAYDEGGFDTCVRLKRAEQDNSSTTNHASRLIAFHPCGG